VLERLTKLRDFDVNRNLSAKSLVDLGLCDPFKLFVKGDPHKSRKLLEGRVRLIFNASLIDNTIARLLFAVQNNTEICTWETISSKPGMGLNDSGISVLTANVHQMASHGGVSESDVKGWDWSVQEWEMLADLERRIKLNNSVGTVWERVARAHYYCMNRKVMVLSDGTMYQQLFPGIMPSGWYNTSSTNSFMRALDHGIIASQAVPPVVPAIVCMGDDALERSIPNAQQLYGALGKTVDMYRAIDSEGFEFCSTMFTAGVGYPVNIDKQLVSLLCLKPTSQNDCYEYFNQFVYEIRHHPEREELIRLVESSGWFDISSPHLDF
jgi:hypothetical protein